MFSKKFHPEDIQDLKVKMRTYKDPYWLTISPPTKDEPLRGDKFIEKYIPIFIKWYASLEHIVIVLEVTESMRFHWHILLDVKDTYKWGIYWRGFISHNNVQTKLYRGFPKGGIEYMFKDIDNTRMHLRYLDCIADYSQMVNAVEIAKAEKRLSMLRTKNPSLLDQHIDLYSNKPVPNCFLPCDTDSELDTPDTFMK